MGAIRRKFTKEFKEAAVRRLELGASLAEIARASEVNPNVLHRWRRELRDHGTKAFAGNGQRRADESRVAELERKVGRQALEDLSTLKPRLRRLRSFHPPMRCPRTE